MSRNIQRRIRNAVRYILQDLLKEVLEEALFPPAYKIQQQIGSLDSSVKYVGATLEAEHASDDRLGMIQILRDEGVWEIIPINSIDRMLVHPNGSLVIQYFSGGYVDYSPKEAALIQRALVTHFKISRIEPATDKEIEEAS